MFYPKVMLIILMNPRWRHPRWRYPKWRPFVVLLRSTALSPQLHSTTILEDNRGNCRYHFESIILVVCGFETFMNLLLYAIGTLVGGIKQNCHFRDRLWWKSRNPCYGGQIKHFLVKKTLKRMMVSGMTDDIIFQKSHLWVKSKKGYILC